MVKNVCVCVCVCVQAYVLVSVFMCAFFTVGKTVPCIVQIRKAEINKQDK